MTASARRHTIGLIALAMLAAAGVFRWGFGSDFSGLYGICSKVGIALAAVWLAYPQVMFLSAYCSPKLLLALALGGMVVIARPKAFPIVALLIGAVAVLEFVGWLLKPLRPPPDELPPGKGRH